MRLKQLGIRQIFFLVCCVAIVIRVGYGVARFGGDLALSGAPFVALWDYDALEHVLISKAILSGEGYVVHAGPETIGKEVRFPGSYALFKAPLYQYFLAMLFGIGGFSFALFFPIQAIFGGMASGLVALITDRVFDNRQAGLLAGLAAAVHPILINTASQPYNENVFFFLFVLTIWLFLKWLRSGTLAIAVVCGISAGATALMRESILGPFLLMVAFGAIMFWRERRMPGVLTAPIALAAAVLTIAPWTLYTYVNLGVVIPISSITGTVLGTGNNECVAAEGMTTPFYGDSPCRSLDNQRKELLDKMPKEPRVVNNDRAYGTLGMRFVREHPVDYLLLCVRRFWTALLPYHPKQGLGMGQKSLIIGYYLLVLVVGAATAIRCAFRRPSREVMLLLVVLFGAFLPLVLIFVSHDGRFRIGVDLVLACFAGYGWARLLKLQGESKGAAAAAER